jgi:hypothetical protein
MSSDSLMENLAAVAPISDADVAAADLGIAERALLAEIVSLGPASRPRAGHSAAWLRFTPARAALGVGTAVAAAAVAIVLVGSNGGGTSSAFAAEAVAVAEANPRLLVTEPGWEVNTANQFSPENGTVIFSDKSGHTLEMNWTEASQYPVLLRDRRYGEMPTFDLQVLGRSAPTFHQGAVLDIPDYETLIPPTGPTFVYVRGSTANRAQYVRVVESLESTDVNTWLSAMPDSVVKPNESAATVDEMLDGIPLPPGFDIDAILSGVDVSSRYHLAARVTSYVTCGWLDSWVAARDAGDQHAADRAVEAMATSRQWPILKEIARSGGWSHGVWEYADRLAAGDVRRQVYDQEMNCIEFR